MEKINIWKDFFELYYKDYIQSRINFLTVNFSDISKFDPKLAEKLLEEPDTVINEMELALNELVSNLFLTEEDKTNVKVRIKNLPEQSKIQIGHIRKRHIGKFICVEGIIRQITSVEQMISKIIYECKNCGFKVPVINELFQNALIKPRKCINCNCKSFGIVKKEFIDYQIMVLEEPLDLLSGGEQPSQIHVVLLEDLTDPALTRLNYPGARMIVNGILRDYQENIRKDRQTAKRTKVIEVNYIKATESDYQEVKITKEDIDKIKKVSSTGKALELFVKSFAPDIYGYDHIKKALILQQFGGLEIKHKGKLVKSGEFHILLIGDTSTGKSRLSDYLRFISPKVRFTSATGSTVTGLIGSVVRDDLLGNWAWQSGVVLLTNNGTVVVDELDKISPDEQQKLNDVLSSHEVKIDKATIHASFKTKISLLAIANPKRGRFTTYSDILEEMNISNALLSRFDLIFPIKDIIDRDKDKKIIEKIINVFSKPEETLKTDLEPDFIKKYIIYAKKTCFPKLTESAKYMIIDLYPKLRVSNLERDIEAVPITSRQGDALVRLSTAIARANLSDKVTVEHVNEAYELMKSFLKEICIDIETGVIDIDVVESKGVTQRKREIIQEIEEFLKIKKEEYDMDLVPIEDIIEHLKEKGFNEYKIEETIEKMKRNGFIYEPRNGFIKLME